MDFSAGCEWVPHTLGIQGAVAGQHVTDLQKPWRRIRKSAKIEDVRIHDLRHTFASVAVSHGESLYMAGRLLGHTQAQTTMRYAHLATNPIQNASERVCDVIAQSFLIGNGAQKRFRVIEGGKT